MPYLDALAKMVSEVISDETERNWESYVEGDEILPDEDVLLYNSLHEVAEKIHHSGLLDSHPAVIRAIKEAKLTIREIATDTAAYRRAMSGTVEDQLRYHGLSIKDFV